jgi:hypothetical protein
MKATDQLRRQELTQRAEGYRVAYQERDLERMLAMFADDAVMLNGKLSRQCTSRNQTSKTHGTIVLPDSALDVIKRNVVAGRKFSQMLAEARNRYQNRTIDAAKSSPRSSSSPKPPRDNGTEASRPASPTTNSPSTMPCSPTIRHG